MRKLTPDKEIALKIEERYNLAHSITLIESLFQEEDWERTDEAVQDFIDFYNNLNGDPFDFLKFHRSLEKKIIKMIVIKRDLISCPLNSSSLKVFPTFFSYLLTLKI